MFSRSRFFILALLACFALVLEHTDTHARSVPEPMTISPDGAFSDPRLVEFARAAKNGDSRRVRELVDKGVDVNACGAKGVTALLFALEYRQREAFLTLLSLGANPNIPCGTTSVIELALVHPVPFFLEAALQHGGDPNFMNPQTRRPLIMTAMSYRKERIATLVKAGADVNIMAVGETPVTYAAEIGQFDIVLELLKVGGDPFRKNDTGVDLIEIMRETRAKPTYKMNARFKAVEEYLETKFKTTL